MSTIGPDFPEGTAHLFTWVADKLWGGAKSASGWAWNQAQWNMAQDAYDAAIIDQYGKIRIFGQTTPKSLRNIFTDVYVLNKPTGDRRYSFEELSEHFWTADRGLSFRQGEAQPGEQALERGTKFYILGKPGAGKTTFLKRLAVREAQRGRWGRCLGKVPIFVPLKQFDESGKSLFDYIVDQFAVCHFPEAAPFIRGLLESGSALVLFDGLDEVTKAEDFQADRRGQVSETLEQFARQYNDCHIVITCRIAANNFTFGSQFTYLEMSDFSPEQVDHFVRNWFGNDAEPQQGKTIAEDMLEELAQPEHGGIRDLARSPLLLTLLCLNYEETRNFPARRVEIYEEALDALLKKWDNTRNIRRGGLYRAVSLGRKRQMFAQIAYDAFTRNEILFRQANLEAQIKAYLQHVPELPDPIDIEADVVLKEIIAQHGIFSEQARGLFSFAHLTFQEYYAAQYISETASPAVIKSLLSHIDDLRWREVFSLTASLLRDGKPFLKAFEGVLQQWVSRSTQLVAWLRLAGQQAQASETGYRLPALRAWLVATCARVRTRTLARARNLALDLDRDLDLDRFFDRARNLARNRNPAHFLVRDLDSDHAFHSDFDRDRAFDRAFDRAVDRALDLDRDLTRWDQLKAETAAFRKATQQFKLSERDAKTLLAYVEATRLFYDCLQLAYVPDRQAFEERLFLPPLDEPAEG